MKEKVFNKIFSKDISEKLDFYRIGYHYTNIDFDSIHHCGIWKLEKFGGNEGYEVIKGMKRKNPDGNVVYSYPGDEDFGIYGFFTYDIEKARMIMRDKFQKNDED